MIVINYLKDSLTSKIKFEKDVELAKENAFIWIHINNHDIIRLILMMRIHRIKINLRSYSSFFD